MTHGERILFYLQGEPDGPQTFARVGVLRPAVDRRYHDLHDASGDVDMASLSVLPE